MHQASQASDNQKFQSLFVEVNIIYKRIKIFPLINEQLQRLERL